MTMFSVYLKLLSQVIDPSILNCALDLNEMDAKAFEIYRQIRGPREENASSQESSEPL